MFFSFINQKGGVGKTTSAINLGSCIANLGYKVLLIDFDSQGNLSSGMGVHSYKGTIYDILSQNKKISDVILSTCQENLYVIPSNNSLSGASIELVSLDNREWYLSSAIEPIKKDFDFVFIDCPPSLGMLTINAFCASDSIIIPLQCEYFAMEGIAQLIQNIKNIKKVLKPNLNIFGIILTMYDSRTKISQEVASEIVKVFGAYVFNTIIPRNVKIAEAPSFGKPLLLYDKTCVGTQSYQHLAEEVIKKWKKKTEKN